MSETRWEGAEALRAFLVPVDALVPFPGNPFRGEQHVDDVAKSLRDFKQARPILTWENAEEFDLPANTIVGGHHVWFAAKSDTLRWTHVAAIPHRFESVDAARNYLAMDNLLTQRDSDELGHQLSITDIDGYSQEMKDRLLTATRSEKLEDIGKLKLHERSVRQDPEDVIQHIASSLREVGWTDEQVITARDGTILVGESVLKAAAVAGIDKLPVRKLDVDPDSPEALKIMAKHYGVGKRAMVDDRQFAEMLKNIKEELESLEGTGYDPEMLAGMLLATRTAAEIRDAEGALEWVGLPEFESVKLPVKHFILFQDDETRDLFFEKANTAGLGLGVINRRVGTTSGWWPSETRKDPRSLRFADRTRDKWKDKVTSEDTVAS